jgi:hypothetical protein
MTRFNDEPCPKLAQFIVSYIRLVIEHPDVVESASCKNHYMGLLYQLESITITQLEQRKKWI